ILSLLLTLLVSPVFAADWSVGPATSDDPTMTAATVRNEDGHVLFLWGREADGRYQVFAELHLRGGESFGAAMPRYRINGGETVETDTVRQQGEELGALWGHVGRDAAFWMVWTSIQNAILPSDAFAAWLTGKEIEITYTAADGTDKTTRFSLAGAADAVRDATGLEPPSGD
ncbi:MAG: hypothetical protein ACREEV_14200, partial [Dongiaceae bacterium]